MPEIITQKDTVFRLSSYKNTLYRLKALGMNKVYSDNIADTLGISSSLVRKDFHTFGISGQQKGGYSIDRVLETILHILGKNKEQYVVIIGAGRIGQALMHYRGFEKDNITIKAAFDTDAQKINPDSAIPVFPAGELMTYVSKNNIRIAILAVPEHAAFDAAEKCRSAGIVGILNFTPANLRQIPEVCINNVNIEHELENLVYCVHNFSSGLKE